MSAKVVTNWRQYYRCWRMNPVPAENKNTSFNQTNLERKKAESSTNDNQSELSIMTWVSNASNDTMLNNWPLQIIQLNATSIAEAFLWSLPNVSFILFTDEIRTHLTNCTGLLTNQTVKHQTNAGQRGYTQQHLHSDSPACDTDMFCQQDVVSVNCWLHWRTRALDTHKKSERKYL